MIPYLDDYGGVASPAQATTAFQALLDLLAELGLEDAPDKRVTPSTSMAFLGIVFDTVSMTMHIPEPKVREIAELLSSWTNKQSAVKRELQSLLGKLHFAANCIKAGRLFVSRMLDVLRQSPASGIVTVDAEFRKDIAWWKVALQAANSTFVLDHLSLSVIDAKMELDACPTGIGGISQEDYYYAEIPPACQTLLTSSAHFEFLNVVIAVKLWAPRWSGKRVQFACDNTACVSILNTGRSHDTFLLHCAREIWRLSTVHDVLFSAVYLPGVENVVADALSRWHMRTPSNHVSQVLSSKKRRIIPEHWFKTHAWISS